MTVLAQNPANAVALPPREPAAAVPPERRGLARDGVKLMVADAADGAIGHRTFDRIGEALLPGDVLVINVSAALPASVDGVLAGGAVSGSPVRVHLSSPVAGDVWTVEPRRPLPVGSEPWRDLEGGTVSLPGGAEVVLLVRDARSPRLWLAELRGMCDVPEYLQRHGQPIRYAHLAADWPMSDYSTVYASVPGSAEMPSAGRPFTAELVTALAAAGIAFAPVVLHSGVASFEAGELPDAERYAVPAHAARLINEARAAGGRAIAVGTTSVRALETVTDTAGIVHPGAGVTDLIITPERGVRAVDGIITGWHESGASHLELVSAVGGRGLLERCYEEARSSDYLWHEFGDSLLVIGSRASPRGGLL